MTHDRGDAGISRRETLKRGAALGGAVVWATPVVQSLTMRPAYAQASPPPGTAEGPSYIAFNLTFSGDDFVAKLECNGSCDWDDGPSKFPGCGSFTPSGEKAHGGDLGVTFTGPDPSSGCVSIHLPAGSTITQSAIKMSQSCCPGATGSGTLIFCPTC